MAAKAGVWIDHKKAVVVLVTDAGQEIKKFPGVVEPSTRPVSSTRSKNKYTPNDFIAEDRREQKLANERKKVFDEVLAFIRSADSLLILGPGEAKGEFSKHIKAKKLRGLAVELETTDKLTQRQLAARVSEHFSKTRAGNTLSSNKKAKSASGKATNKTRK